MMSPSSPIVVLDSGLGGLTVVRALRAVLPGEDVVYFGDTARLPYGSKAPATITHFVRQIITYLRPLRPKHVVLACNTASAVALPAVRAAFPDLTISGVVEPGAKAAVVAAGARKVPVIGVIATESTVRSKAYERAIMRLRNHARLLLQPTPLLVPLIEEGRRTDDPVVALALRQYLEPLMKHRMDVLVLGCTHYPILRDAIAATVGPGVRVIDSAQQCADDVARRLGSISMTRSGGALLRPAGLLTDRRPGALVRPVPAYGASRPLAAGYGALRCFVTDDPPRFAALAARFLSAQIDPPTWVSPDELYATVAPSTPAFALRRPA